MELPSAPEIGKLLLENFTIESYSQIFRALVIAVIGFPIIFFFARIVRSALSKHFSKHFQLLAHKIVIYLGSLLLIASILVQLGFDISTILGALAIIAIALGFAAQSSLSNVVTGIFLFWEEPLAVGDIIEIDETHYGYVLSIDLLSVKVRTFNNHYIRIPNEVLIKNTFINHTRFPIRRLDLEVRVGNKENLDKVFEALRTICRKNKFSLEEPAPWIAVRTFKEFYIDIHYGVWVAQTNYFNLKEVILKEVKDYFDEAGIEIPSHHITLYSGRNTAPMPLDIHKA